MIRYYAKCFAKQWGQLLVPVVQTLISAEVDVVVGVGEEEPDELTFEEVVHELLHSRVTC